jgi:hypothetical protein
MKRALYACLLLCAWVGNMLSFLLRSNCCEEELSKVPFHTHRTPALPAVKVDSYAVGPVVAVVVCSQGVGLL